MAPFVQRAGRIIQSKSPLPPFIKGATRPIFQNFWQYIHCQNIPLAKTCIFREFFATDGDFFGLNHANKDNPQFGRLGDESVSGHWLYAFLRSSPRFRYAFENTDFVIRSLGGFPQEFRFRIEADRSSWNIDIFGLPFAQGANQCYST